MDPNIIIGEGSLFAFNGRSRISPISMMTDLSNIPDNIALRNAVFRVWAFVKTDSNGTKTVVNFNETDKREFKAVYDTYFRADDMAAEQYCVSDCSASGDTRCYECLKEYFAVPLCSRDNFAIRPEGFIVTVKDTNGTENNASVTPIVLASNTGTGTTATLAAGYRYRLDASATLYGNSGTAIGYYADFDGNDTDRGDTAIAKFHGSTTCADRSSHGQQVSMRNGSTDLTPSALRINNTGPYYYYMTDLNWTDVDRASYPYKTVFDPSCKATPSAAGCNDCQLGTSTVSPSTAGKIGCRTESDFYGKPDLQMQPYEFKVEATPTFKPDINQTESSGAVVHYLLMNDFNTSYFGTPALQSIEMATVYDGNISALAKGGTVTTNFTDGCSAKDINLTLYFDDNNYTGKLLYDDSNHAGRVGYTMQLWLQSKNMATPYADTEATGIIIDPTDNSDHNGTVTLPAGAFDTHDDGVSHIFLSSTIQKLYRESSSPDINRSSYPGTNPIRITYHQIKAMSRAAASHAYMKAKYIPKGHKDQNATAMYLYGKITPGKEYYHNIINDNATTAIYADIYCDTASSYFGYPVFATGTYGQDEDPLRWHFAKDLFGATDLGTVELNATYCSGGSGPTLSAPAVGSGTHITVLLDEPHDAMHQKIYVHIPTTASRPKLVCIPYTPPPWLVYDKDKDYYRVNFIGSGSWNGVGTTGSVSQTRSGETNRPRMNW
jgi:hypothetical protein